MTTLNHQRAIAVRSAVGRARRAETAAQTAPAGTHPPKARKASRAATQPATPAVAIRAETPARPAAAAPPAGPTPPEFRLDEHERRIALDAIPELSVREREVLFAICEGGRNAEIAKRLHIAPPTLRTHLTRLNHKLGTQSKADLVRLVARAVLAAYRAGRGAETEASVPSPTGDSAPEQGDLSVNTNEHCGDGRALDRYPPQE